MNSIESYSPPKVTSLDEESSLVSDLLTSDQLALEALRALMGTPETAQPAFGVQVTLPETKSQLTPELTDRLANLMQALVGDENVPPSLLPVLTSLRETLTQSGGDLASDSEALEQIQALLTALKAEPAPSPLTISNTASATEALRKALEEAFVSNGAPQSVAADQGEIPSGSEQTAPEMVGLGQSILQSLDSQSAAAASAQVSGPATAERIEQVSSLMSEMADRVLVTDPLHGQNTEVRIKIAENIMPGTEVRVWREDGGQLRVEFDTTNAYWARVLNDSTTQLSQRLNERLNLPEGAQVTVQHDGGQPQDGRSRNRYTPWELAQQDNQ